MRRLVELAMDRIVAHIESLPSQPSVDVEGGVELARSRRERLPEDFLRGVLYASDQVHHSVQKAAMLAGFPPQNVHAVASDARFRLDLEALRSTIAADRAAGRTPFLVVGTAGTTNTGAVDDLAALAALAGAEGLWLHVRRGLRRLLPPHRARPADHARHR